MWIFTKENVVFSFFSYRLKNGFTPSVSRTIAEFATKISMRGCYAKQKVFLSWCYKKLELD